MSTKQNFTPETKSFHDLIDTSNKYKIPRYQRNYSWKESQWNELWEDIVDATEDKHYTGAMVIKEGSDNSDLYIIDGQQRFTTISLIIISSLYLLKEYSDKITNEDSKSIINNQRKEFKEQFIGKRDILDLTEYCKLSLSDVNNDFYKEVASISVPLKEIKTQNGDKLNENILKCINFFYKKTKAYFKDTNKEINFKNIFYFIKDNVSKKIIFTVITVHDDISAYNLFETLNARGLDLAASDLIKNHFLMLASKHSDKKVNIMKKDYFDHIENSGLDLDLTKLFLWHFNSIYPKTTEKRLYKTITNRERAIVTKDNCFDFIKGVKDSALIYQKIKNPQDYFEDKELIKICNEINLFKNIKQHYIIIFSIFKNFQPCEVKKALNLILIILVRYNVICNEQANKQEIIYNNIAIKINNKTYTKSYDIIPDLKELYMLKSFESKFSDKVFKSTSDSKVVRYLLASIEDQLNGPHISYNDYTLEHVHDKKDLTIDDEYKYSIGNLTLLKKKDNGSLSEKNFDGKLDVYKQSGLKISESITLNKLWGVDQIMTRSNLLSNIATLKWSISKLDNQ